MNNFQAVRDLTPPSPRLTPLYKVLMYAGIVISPISLYLSPIAEAAGYSIYSITAFNAFLGFLLGSMIAKMINISAHINNLRSWQLRHTAYYDLGCIRFNNRELERLRMLTDALTDEVFALKELLNKSGKVAEFETVYTKLQGVPSVASLLKKRDV